MCRPNRTWKKVKCNHWLTVRLPLILILPDFGRKGNGGGRHFVGGPENVFQTRPDGDNGTWSQHRGRNYRVQSQAVRGPAPQWLRRGSEFSRSGGGAGGGGVAVRWEEAARESRRTRRRGGEGRGRVAGDFRGQRSKRPRHHQPRETLLSLFRNVIFLHVQVASSGK